MQQARKFKIQVQDVHEEKMNILALDSAKPLESNNYMVFVSVEIGRASCRERVLMPV